MATFYELKQLIGRVFGIREMDDNEDDIIIDFSGNLRFRRYAQCNNDKQPETSIVLKNSEIFELYNNVINTSYLESELYSSSKYEVGVNIDRMRIHGNDITQKFEDLENGLEYELSSASAEFCVCLLLQLIDKMNEQDNRFPRGLPVRLRRPVDYTNFWDENGDITLKNVLQSLVNEVSLKIKNCKETQVTLLQYRKYKTSFIFEFMYKSNIAITEYNDIMDVFQMNSLMRPRADISQFDSVPLREYCSDVVDYYKLSLASHDPYIKYLSFYHIMEYFFDEVFKNKMVNDLRDKITHPDFSYKNEEKIFEIAKFIKNRWHTNDESGQGDELESLKFVLNEYVPIDELRTRIESIDSEALQYYKENKVSFSNAPTIGWSDNQGVITQIAKRIYFTRNSLVHSKSGKNKERYKPYKDEKQLQKEIPLMKAVAELIIINSSKIM